MSTLKPLIHGIFGFSLLLPLLSVAEEANEYESPPRITVKSVEKNNFLDKQRTFVTNQLVDLTDALDRLLSRQGRADENNSYLVLDLESVFSEGGERELNTRVKAKADLPNTKSRYKLIFESGPEGDFSPKDNELSGQTGSEGLTSDSAIAGIEYSKKRAKNKWRPSLGVGARFQFPIDPFVRLKLGKQNKLSDSWRLDTRVNMPYYAQEGAKPSVRASFIKDLSITLSFTSVSHYKHTRKIDLHESFQSFQLNHFLSQGRGMEYKIGAYRTSEGEEGRGYFIQLSYKKSVYRDWMYLVFVPQVNYPETDDWHPNYAFVMQLEAIYSR
ncbi:MAG: hypothetical protein K6L80_03805 [Agarilytica sp.]